MIAPQPTLSDRLARLLDSAPTDLLQGGLKGIEKESLRVTRDGLIARTPHPPALGSPLTHPHITTDYSEALLEFITPPFSDNALALDYLRDIHLFVYEQVKNELLLAASMPCGIDGDDSIPIARYGSSNIGQMKHIYRHGLWHRYGRAMQCIAGIHFNYSVPELLWPALHRLEKSSTPVDGYIADNYFALIRNFLRCGWLVLYLFGSSPAICKRFFKSRPHLMNGFDEFDGNTLFHPYATSLRMSDIGYKSTAQANLEINFNSLDGYVAALDRATRTPYPDYERIGVKVDGTYQQLSNAILQIENEFYATIRPKQVTRPGEKPSRAMLQRGVRYIEIRSLDLDLFCPIGICRDTACFLEALLLNCLFRSSPPTTAQELRRIDANQLAVARRGREPGLLLHRGSTRMQLQDWAEEIIEQLQPICRLLDGAAPGKPYSTALETHLNAVRKPALTPSARQLEQMTASRMSYAPFALKISADHAAFFRHQHLSEKQRQEMNDMAKKSLAKQCEIENGETAGFDEFLASYFAQP